MPKPKIPDSHFFLSAAAFSGLFSIFMGAFIHHHLKQSLPSERIDVYQTAIHYQMFHSAALAIISLVDSGKPNPLLIKAGWLYMTGIALFSGSLYTYAISGFRFFSYVTPVGGLVLLMAWLFFFWGSLKRL